MVFTAPSGGWTGKDFQLIYQKKVVISVTDQITKKTWSIQLSPYGTLALSSLEQVFPGCSGLKYSIPSIGDNFVVPFNDKKMVFTAPSGGWTGKDFQLIYKQKIPPIPPVVISVTDQITKKPRGIQLSPDGTLAFSSLERVFPGCWGLECSIPSIGENCVVPFDDKKMVFTEPYGGWTGKDFQLIYQQQIPPIVKALPDTRKLVKPYKYVHGDLPKFDELSEYLFFIMESNHRKSCVTSITKHYFVTFYHNHETWKIGNSLKIYRHDSKSGINNKQFFIATVKSINKKLDFILLKTDKEINNHKPFYCKPPFRSLPVGYYGYGNDFNTLSYCEGVIHADELQTFLEKGVVHGPFLLGTIKSTGGDSGAAVWSPEGLVGLNLGFVDFTANTGKSALSMELQLAHFDKKNYIVTIDRIMEQLMV
ncbi:unnamed protein product [Meloidogyne enterolobii]|uniref:Uncharacterized protein n=2 Tax=Meloidogyne enterolobii TaxID=390850 RepID=A0ACB1B395_MELEN